MINKKMAQKLGLYIPKVRKHYFQKRDVLRAAKRAAKGIGYRGDIEADVSDEFVEVVAPSGYHWNIHGEGCHGAMLQRMDGESKSDFFETIIGDLEDGLSPCECDDCVMSKVPEPESVLDAAYLRKQYGERSGPG